MPSEQTTVDPELGTTTVVDLAGGGGLLLLIQPDNEAEKHKVANEANTIFT